MGLEALLPLPVRGRGAGELIFFGKLLQWDEGPGRKFILFIEAKLR